MNEQIKELALRTGEVIYDAVGNDPKALSSIVVYIVSQIADGIKADSDYSQALIYLADTVDKLDTLGRMGTQLLSEAERAQLEALAFGAAGNA